MKNSNSAAAFTLCLFVPATHSAQQPQTSLRLVELNGDMQKDRLINRADGAIEISLGMGLRQFELISQVMPKAHVIDLVAEDLNGDGITDLYLLTNHTNIALLGDGTGLFREATLELGLQDEGVGIGIELDDVDNDGIADLLLHNQTSDVLFWGIPGGFERDEATPFVSMSLPSSEVNVALPYKEQKNGLRGTVNSAPFDAQPTSNGSVHLPGSSRTPVSGSSNSSATPTILPSIASLPPGTFTSPRFPLKSPIGLNSTQLKILSHFSIEELPDGLGGTAKTIRVSGANLQIVNGTGATNGDTGNPTSLAGATNSVGNLIIGYNELGNPNGDDRTGSHNLVVGLGNTYSNFGGLVASNNNSITGAFATVSGGTRNVASSDRASVSGGTTNTASGTYASISGGNSNQAQGFYDSVAGGSSNIANSISSTISGGRDNTANNFNTSVTGGRSNVTGSNYRSSYGVRH
ncbi:MAG: hypothetical protein ACI87A_002700, partial [Planctomycetota bacterium]